VSSDFLVCGDPAGASVPGSVIDRCSRCNALITISPSGQRMLDERHLKPLCIPCAQTTGEGLLPGRVQPPTPEQIAELAAYYARRQ
jgi:hypothetical protein